jgi:hypothetical protein
VLEQNLSAVNVTLSPEARAACDEVWDGLHPPRLFYGR